MAREKPNFRVKTIVWRRFAEVRRGGFALVVTVSLMALLLLLAVGLLGLSGVVIRGDGQDAAMATARANARLAMMMALGDLQRSVGPDGRITVTADQGVAKSGPHRGWTGVYEAWDADRGFVRRPEPKFVNWLVGAGDPAGAAVREFAGAAAGAAEVAMVGEGTLGKDALADERVSVPRVPVGQGGQRGEMAWWVADESMKAHVVSGAERPGKMSGAEELLAANAGLTPNGGVLEDLGELPIGVGGRKRYLTTWQLALKNPDAGGLFHDVTTVSRGLAVDVTRGRPKLDFSIFAQRPRRQVTGMPLYKADGAVNTIDVRGSRLTGDPRFRSAGADLLAAFGDRTNQPGIHLEELWVHSNVYRTVRWRGGQPELRMMDGAENTASTDFRHRALSDPWFSHTKPVFASVQFVFSFVSKPSTAFPGKFRMLMQMDALVKVWNPNNVRVVVPPGASFAVQLLAVPFQVQWSIAGSDGVTVNRPQSGIGNNTYAMSWGNWGSSSSRFGQRSFQWLRGNIGGLAAKGASAGYTLEAGECKVFGYDQETSTANWAGDPNVNLSPGWGPGRQALIVADFGADNLGVNDSVEFIVSPDPLALPTSGSRTYCNKWIGHRAAGAASQGGNGGLALGSSTLPQSYSFTNPDPVYFPVIRSSQRLRVSQYNTPKPFMIFGHYMNVEQTSAGTRDAVASVPRLLTNSAVTTRRFRGFSLDQMTAFQELWRCDPLPLAYDSPLIDINSKDQGRFGGSHSAGAGVTRCATRQLDVAPPVSLMSLTHAIANGFADRFGQAAERGAKGLDVLQSDGLGGAFKFESGDIAFSTVTYAAPQVERAIGNSFATPFLRPGEVVGAGAYHSGTGAVVPLMDHAYLANVALFDGWFCSSLHDGTLIPRGAPYEDPRGVGQVLTDFFERSATDREARLMNPRVIPAVGVERAKARVLNGGVLHEEAMKRMGALVFLEGAFNVNSTRKEAWKALLATSRGVMKRVAGGDVRGGDERTATGASGLVVTGAAKPLAQPTEVEQWSGYRDLDDDALDELAGEIVEEVRKRGPFLSLGDFLNRRPGGSGDEQWMGAVQAAIEGAGLNEALKGAGRVAGAGDFGNLPGAGLGDAGGGMARSAGIPGYLMQADVLAPVANQLAPRGDTFRVRGYGSAKDAGGKIVAEAWCEAIFQRLPEYVDLQDEADVARADLKGAVNRVFGRRFEMVSFRWLPRGEV
jgi:hypothetical protein